MKQPQDQQCLRDVLVKHLCDPLLLHIQTNHQRHMVFYWLRELFLFTMLHYMIEHVSLPMSREPENNNVSLQSVILVYDDPSQQQHSGHHSHYALEEELCHRLENDAETQFASPCYIALFSTGMYQRFTRCWLHDVHR